MYGFYCIPFIEFSSLVVVAAGISSSAVVIKIFAEIKSKYKLSKQRGKSMIK